jgi:predicted phosphodiesterase
VAIFAWSDLHTDYAKSLERIAQLSQQDYREDSILLAGDISHQVSTIETTLRLFTQRFRHVFFVPGNHDLWLYRKDYPDSLQKLDVLRSMCDQCGVFMTPQRIPVKDSDGSVQIVPLLSWYRRPEHGDDSLYISKVGEDPTLRMWMDNYRIQWPEPLNEAGIADYFVNENAQQLAGFDINESLPVISMSHFLPHRHLMFQDQPIDAITAPIPGDPYPAFNFSRVAGSTAILQQAATLRPRVHVYGHQHRNRWRKVDDIWFVSHCLGYPEEPRMGPTGDRHLPAQVWPLPATIAAEAD